MLYFDFTTKSPPGQPLSFTRCLSLDYVLFTFSNICWLTDYFTIISYILLSILWSYF